MAHLLEVLGADKATEVVGSHIVGHSDDGRRQRHGGGGPAVGGGVVVAEEAHGALAEDQRLHRLVHGYGFDRKLAAAEVWGGGVDDDGVDAAGGH